MRIEKSKRAVLIQDASARTDLIATFNRLIETCRHGERGFRNAFEQTEEPVLKKLFWLFSQQRARFARELTDQIIRLGEAPKRELPLIGHHSLGEEHEILKYCRSLEEKSLHDFEAALQTHIPTGALFLIEAQYSFVRQAYARICALTDRAEHSYTGNAYESRTHTHIASSFRTAGSF